MTPEADIVYTDAEGRDQGILSGCKLDVEFGDRGNDFELTCPEDVRIDYGAYVYVEGTEWGGIVDRANPDTAEHVVRYKGRSWHGVLGGKVLCPGSGEDRISVSGDANAALAEVVRRCGLEGLFSARGVPSGIAVSFSFRRFCDAWSGIREMLSAHGAKPRLSFDGERVEIWAEPAADYSAPEEWDSDRADVELEHDARPVNHLVCAGEGELGERVVVHLYADASGAVSEDQSLFGEDEVAAYYNYTNADAAQLREDGGKRLEEMQSADSCSVSVASGSYGLGDVVGANDPLTGRQVSAAISCVTAIVSNGFATVSYKAGQAGASSSLPSSGGSSGGAAAYVAGRGIEIAGRTISAKVATPGSLGIVRPDGETITVDSDGVLHAEGGGDIGAIIDAMVAARFAELDFRIDERGHLMCDIGSEPANDVEAMIRDAVEARISLMDFEIDGDGILVWTDRGAR